LSQSEIGLSRAAQNFAREVNAGAIAAEQGLDAAHRFIMDEANAGVVKTALRIRAVESSLYDLFGKGKLHGTIHTCIGQEFSGALLGRHLKSGDFVTSNHRCHGHFIGATGNWRGLIDELIGNAEGVCAGIGSSQHLCATNFMSNGQQGGMLPVAAGIALDRKVKDTGNVVVSFIGEGTLGEGIVYETFNLDALWDLPHVIICENNFYSQSTAQARSVAGSILERAAGFGIAAAAANTWDLPNFDRILEQTIERARKQHKPAFIVVQTYRLNPHSKGDDQRDRGEIEWFRAHDPASLAVSDYQSFRALYEQYVAEADEQISLGLAKATLPPTSYFLDQLPRAPKDAAVQWRALPAVPEDRRIAQQLNGFFHDWLARDEDAFFIGEDIEDPYGGAFKISKGFTTAFAGRAITTPISEAAITGIGVGLAVAGRRPFIEIMFGDFITYAFDQIVNNASKIYNMYNRQLDCPLVVRTPMGGRRGYGPTHSQSLERFLHGIDNVCLLGLNSLISVAQQLAGLEGLRCPVVLIENKADYANKVFSCPEDFALESDGAALPMLRITPQGAEPTVTLLAYGGIARLVADGLLEIFERTDQVPELLVPIILSPLNPGPIAASVRRTGRLVVIEEGAGTGSVGAEAIAQVSELVGGSFSVARAAGKPMAIPSVPALEAAALPSLEDICAAVLTACAEV